MKKETREPHPAPGLAQVRAWGCALPRFPLHGSGNKERRSLFYWKSVRLWVIQLNRIFQSNRSGFQIFSDQIRVRILENRYYYEECKLNRSKPNAMRRELGVSSTFHRMSEPQPISQN